jgi:hypothetical protein
MKDVRAVCVHRVLIACTVTNPVNPSVRDKYETNVIVRWDICETFNGSC